MPMRTTFARDMTLGDLNQNNIVLSGSKSANPWLELYDPQILPAIRCGVYHQAAPPASFRP